MVWWTRVAAGVIAVGVLLVTGIVGGVAGGAVGAAAHTKTPPTTVPADQTGPAGFAQLYVTAWVSGDPQAIGQYIQPLPDLTQAPAGVLETTSTTAYGTTNLGHGYWAVLVAAAISGDTNGSWKPLGVRYYNVGVYTLGGRYTATALPEEIATPSGLAAPTTDFGPIGQPASDDAQVITVTGFLRALLCGQGALNRYTPVGSALQAVTPPPFTSTTVTGIAKRQVPASRHHGAFTRVLVEAEASDSQNRTQLLTYTLDLVRLAGQWEVGAIESAVPLASGAASRS